MGSKKVFVTMIALVALLSLAALASADNPPGVDDKEIRIGQWGPQTGPAAPWGSVARGSKLLFDIVNEEGGINGRPIELVLGDTESEPTKAVMVAKKFINVDKVAAIIGPDRTDLGMAGSR